MNKEIVRTIIAPRFNKIDNLIKWAVIHRAKNHDFRKHPAKLIKIDFGKCDFLKPYHVAPLACLIHEYHKKGFHIKLVKIPKKIKEYLDTFNFNQFCKKEDKNNFPTPLNSQTLPLWRIEQKATSVYPKQAQEYFEKNNFNGKSLFALSVSLAELMNNVFDHSESKIPGYTFTQYDTQSNEVITCVCDFGVGIPKKVNKFLKEKGMQSINNMDALSKAIELRFSTLSKPHNRGFGWDNIICNIKSLKSKMLIVSNNALYWLLNDGKIIIRLLNENFPGTLVVIYLNALNLPTKEEELTDELTVL